MSLHHKILLSMALLPGGFRVSSMARNALILGRIPGFCAVPYGGVRIKRLWYAIQYKSRIHGVL